ncbi:MAG: hypothetical protein ACT4OJ_07035 [Bacteroidota bacterium]
MYPELYQYLLQHKQLPLPGIGTIVLERKPASIDFPNKLMYPPGYSFALQPSAFIPSGRFFNWLGAMLGISQMDAVIRFNDFIFEMKKQVERGDTVNWNGVGIIKKGLGGEIKFSAGEITTERPVPAAKVLRGKAEHTVRVGEEEKTSAEMVEMLTQTPEKRSYWWAYALAIGLLAVIFIGWYFSEHGMDAFSAANDKKLVPAAATATYKELP